MSINSTIVLNHNHLDWIRRNPAVFVNGLISRLEQGETDPYPGYARWNGDAMPGVQVVHTGHSNDAAVIITMGNSGKKVAVVGNFSGSAMPTDVDALKAMASRLGYNVRKRPGPTSASKKKQREMPDVRLSRKPAGKRRKRKR